MNRPTLILGARAIEYASLAELAGAIFTVAARADVSFRPCTASWPGYGGFPAAICATPEGTWFATAAIQDHGVLALARAFADVAQAEARKAEAA